jgi:hypothetical protein
MADAWLGLLRNEQLERTHNCFVLSSLELPRGGRIQAIHPPAAAWRGSDAVALLDHADQDRSEDEARLHVEL